MKSQFEYFQSLDEEGLKNFFSSPQKESQNLEFKSGKVDISNVYKEICSFANTDGGIVIIGTPKEVSSKESDEKVCQGTLIPSDLKLSEDDFLQKISTGISPMPVGIEVHKIKISGGTAFIIYTPKSQHPPHQVNGVYFIRIGTMCKPAPHGIVQALFNQRLQIELEFNFSVRPHFDGNVITNTFCVNVRNKSTYPAQNVEGLIRIAGNARQIHLDRIQPEHKMSNERLRGGRQQLTNSFRFPHAIVDKINISVNFTHIEISHEYVYVQIVIWARETPAIDKFYKVYSNYEIEELDTTLKDDPNFEYAMWFG